MRPLETSIAQRGAFLSRRRGRARRSRFVPWLSVLEDRSLLSLLTVTTNADTGPGSLRDTVAAANPNDVINFSPALTGATIWFGSEIVIDKSLTIQGPGAASLTLDGGGVTRLFHITVGTYADLSGLTFANGLAETGGAVLMEGEGLVLSDCVFVNNTALGIDGDDGLGGALYQDGGYVSIFHTTFQGNHAQGADGGAVPDIGGDSIGAAGGPKELTAGGGFGGGVSVVDGWVSILDSTFAWNTAAGGLGIDDGTTAFNGGDAAGGAIHHNDSLVTVAYTTFTSNSALGGTVESYGAGGVGVGGAISGHSDSRLVVVGSHFDANQAIGGAGGGVASEAGWGGAGRGGAIENGHDATAVIASSWFADNLAQGGAGGVGHNGGDGLGGAISTLYHSTLALTDSHLGKNRAVGGASGSGVHGGRGGGGALFAEAESAIGTVATLAGVTLEHNQAWGGTSAAGTYGGQASGGAILLVDGAYLVMTDSHIRKNVAQGIDAIGATGGGLASVGGTAYLTRVQIVGNWANGGSGGHATGGGLSNTGWATLYLNDSSLCDNVALGGAGLAGDPAGDAHGGGLFNWSSSATIRCTTFKGNQAVGGDAGAGTAGGNAYGGGIYNTGWISQAESWVSKNLAIGGRGTRWVPAGSGRGGGVYVASTALYATYRGRIDANKAVSGGWGGVGEGGGVFVEPGGQAILRQTPVVHNWASTRGHNIFGNANILRW